MIVRTCISKKYVLSSEEEEVLKRAAKILDNLYAYSQENGRWEKDFQEARNSLTYILEEVEFDGEVSYWRDDDTENEIVEQG
nr:MAG TPA: hypothetical protein [Caudoviricetes sp.]